MGEADAPTVERVKAELSAVISKPKLVDKLLRSPPFRFLHDIITSVVKETGFGSDLLGPDDHDMWKFKEDEAKVAFLRRVVLCTHFALGEEPFPALVADPQEVATGKCSRRTCEWLAKLAVAARAPAEAAAEVPGPVLRGLPAAKRLELRQAAALLEEWGLGAVDEAEPLAAAAAARAAQGDDAAESAGAAVQPQLRRLPRQVAERVGAALGQLAAAGIHRVPDMGALHAAATDLPGASARAAAAERALLACRDPAPRAVPTQLTKLAAPPPAPAGDGGGPGAGMDPARRAQVTRKWDAFCEAAFDNEVDTVTDMIDGALSMPLEPVTNDTDGPLSEAAGGGAVDTLKLLLQRGADPNHRGEKRKTPLQRAVMAEKEDVVPLLLEAGADPRLLLIGAEQWHDPEAAPDGAAAPQREQTIKLKLTAGGGLAEVAALANFKWQESAHVAAVGEVLGEGPAAAAGITQGWTLVKLAGQDVSNLKEARAAADGALKTLGDAKPPPEGFECVFRAPGEPDWGPGHPRWDRRVMVLREWDPKELLSDVPKGMRQILSSWDISKTMAALARRQGGGEAAGEEKAAAPEDIAAAEAQFEDLDRRWRAAPPPEAADLKGQRDAARRALRDLRRKAREQQIDDAGGVAVNALCSPSEVGEAVAGRGTCGAAAAASGRCCLLLGGAEAAKKVKLASPVFELSGTPPLALRKGVIDCMQHGQTFVADLGMGDSLSDLTEPLEAVLPGLSRQLLGCVLHLGGLHRYLLCPELPDCKPEGFKPEQMRQFRFAAITASRFPQQDLLDAFFVLAVDAALAGGPTDLGGVYRGLREGNDEYGDGLMSETRTVKWKDIEPHMPNISAAGIEYTKKGDYLEMKGTAVQFCKAGLY